MDVGALASLSLTMYSSPQRSEVEGMTSLIVAMGALGWVNDSSKSKSKSLVEGGFLEHSGKSSLVPYPSPVVSFEGLPLV